MRRRFPELAEVLPRGVTPPLRPESSTRNAVRHDSFATGLITQEFLGKIAETQAKTKAWVDMQVRLMIRKPCSD